MPLLLLIHIFDLLPCKKFLYINPLKPTTIHTAGSTDRVEEEEEEDGRIQKICDINGSDPGGGGGECAEQRMPHEPRRAGGVQAVGEWAEPRSALDRLLCSGC